MTFPNNSVIAASGWNKQNIYLSIYLSIMCFTVNKNFNDLALIDTHVEWCLWKTEMFQNVLNVPSACRIGERYKYFGLKDIQLPLPGGNSSRRKRRKKTSMAVEVAPPASMFVRWTVTWWWSHLTWRRGGPRSVPDPPDMLQGVCAFFLFLVFLFWLRSQLGFLCWGGWPPISSFLCLFFFFFGACTLGPASCVSSLLLWEMCRTVSAGLFPLLWWGGGVHCVMLIWSSWGSLMLIGGRGLFLKLGTPGKGCLFLHFVWGCSSSNSSRVVCHPLLLVVVRCIGSGGLAEGFTLRQFCGWDFLRHSTPQPFCPGWGGLWFIFLIIMCWGNGWNSADVVHGGGGVPPSLSVGWHWRTLVFAGRIVFAFVILTGRRSVSACCW